MKKLLQKLHLWLTTKKELIKNFQEMKNLLDIAINKKKERLVELNQNKVYAIIIEDLDPIKQKDAEFIWREAMRRLDWTPPKLIIVDKNLVEVPGKEGEKNQIF